MTRRDIGPEIPAEPPRTITMGLSLGQQDLDFAEYTDPGHNPMIPHTLALKPGLVIQGGPIPHRALRNSTARAREAAGRRPRCRSRAVRRRLRRE